MSNKPLIIGIDGGASKVSAHIVKNTKDGSYGLTGLSATKEYKNYPEFQTNFKPVELPIQLDEIQARNMKLTQSEKTQSKAYIQAFIDTICDITNQSDDKKVIIGIGMPGIKTADKRGIATMANGPRMPELSTEIEQGLSAGNIALAKPISKLGSDADYCGIGEEFAENGEFRDVQNAYYLGGGTGAADALKLHGKLLSFDSCKTWISKTWEMSNRNGKSMEVFCSLNGIQSLYSELKNVTQKDLIANGIYLEQILKQAQSDEKAATVTCQLVSNNLSRLLFERIITLYEGWQDTFSFVNPNRQSLNANHDYKYTLFEKIIIGQRLGNIMKSTFGNAFLLQPIINNLTALIEHSDSLDERAKSHYLINKIFDRDLLVISNLREAPALGAGIEAYKHWKT